jgi:Zn-dependent metalloprotease
MWMLALGVWLAFGAGSATGQGLDRESADRALADFETRMGGAVAVQWDASRAAPLAVRGFRSQPLDGEPEEAARAFLSANSDLFGANPPELELLRIDTAGGATVVRFSQRAAGLPIVGRETAVQLEAGRATAITGLPRPVQVAAPASDIGEEAAIDIAANRVGTEGHAGRPHRGFGVSKVVLAQGTTGTVAYQVIVPSGPGLPAPAVYIEADGGRVLWVRNLAIH